MSRIRFTALWRRCKRRDYVPFIVKAIHGNPFERILPHGDLELRLWDEDSYCSLDRNRLTEKCEVTRELAFPSQVPALTGFFYRSFCLLSNGICHIGSSTWIRWNSFKVGRVRGPSFLAMTTRVIDKILSLIRHIMPKNSFASDFFLRVALSALLQRTLLLPFDRTQPPTSDSSFLLTLSWS
jgi:hypothetical protein